VRRLGLEGTHGGCHLGDPILAQVASIQLDNATIASVVAALGSDHRPVALDRVRIERQMRDLAMEHVAENLDDEAYLRWLGELRAQLNVLEDANSAGLPADRAVAWLRALGETWETADVAEEKDDLLHAIYERIVVAGRSFVSARLTPAAQQHELTLALPRVVVASPAGFEPATFRLEGGCSVH
jgi:hypothetical protein